MMTIFDMSNGEARKAPDEYSDEVLDAGGLPRPDTCPQLALQEHELPRDVSAQEAAHAERFLAAFYRYQE